PHALNVTTDKYDVTGLCGNGAAYAVQKQAGVDKCDLLIATTSSDERNILCCMVANQLGAKHTIARVRNPEYASYMMYLKDSLKLSMYINPELEAAEEIFRILRFPSATKVSPFMFDRVEMIEIMLRSGSPLVGMSLIKMKRQYNEDILVCSVQRNNEAIIPNGDFILNEGDRISIIGAPASLNSLAKKLYIFNHKIKNVMIIGGSRIAYYLSRQLTDLGMRVKIIDNDIDRCKELSELLTGVQIIHGDARDRELLAEEGLSKMDAFITLTSVDEENIIASMLGLENKVPKVITKISDTDMASMTYLLGLESSISPKDITADSIIRYVRAMANTGESSMKTLYTICGSQVEVMEFHVDGNLDFLGKPLAELPIREQTLIGCIVRDGQPMIAKGSSTIEVNDNVIVVAGKGRIKDLVNILR
ncbi:MAG: Trk system potassium transporter TrkA, partial [Oscillospiraceae bacterium]|nr:Trk system potassium transporter TrkA [Oscillospiraceae bacterium]